MDLKSTYSVFKFCLKWKEIYISLKFNNIRKYLLEITRFGAVLYFILREFNYFVRAFSRRCFMVSDLIDYSFGWLVFTGLVQAVK
jgi:hypothetical protein